MYTCIREGIHTSIYDDNADCDIIFRDLRIFQEYTRLREAAEGHLLLRDESSGWDWDEIEEWWSQFHDDDLSTTREETSGTSSSSSNNNNNK